MCEGICPFVRALFHLPRVEGNDMFFIVCTTVIKETFIRPEESIFGGDHLWPWRRFPGGARKCTVLGLEGSPLLDYVDNKEWGLRLPDFHLCKRDFPWTFLLVNNFFRLLEWFLFGKNWLLPPFLCLGEGYTE